MEIWCKLCTLGTCASHHQPARRDARNRFTPQYRPMATSVDSPKLLRIVHVPFVFISAWGRQCDHVHAPQPPQIHTASNSMREMYKMPIIVNFAKCISSVTQARCVDLTLNTCMMLFREPTSNPSPLRSCTAPRHILDLPQYKQAIEISH